MNPTKVSSREIRDPDTPSDIYSDWPENRKTNTRQRHTSLQPLHEWKVWLSERGRNHSMIPIGQSATASITNDFFFPDK